MAIMQVRSTNPNFSYLIRKNPEGGMLLRAVRKGMTYGWYSGTQAFQVYFRDADNEVSYKRNEQEQFEYLNVSRYNTPLFPLNAINEYFSAPFKALDPRDEEGHAHTVWFSQIHIERLHYIEFFRKHMPQFQFDLSHQAHKSYTLSITTERSLHDLLHLVCVLCLFLALMGEEFLDVTDNILDKYIRSLQVIDAPFYIRSLFARNFLTKKERFAQYRQALEQTERYDIRLAYGSTAQQRRAWIGSRIPFNKSIVDIGCGEGFYALPFAPKIGGSYYAIDIDESCLQQTMRKAAAREIDNLIPYESLALFLETYNGEQVDIILTEVIEHMPLEEAGPFVRQIVESVTFDHLIITTPNADFNAWYELDDVMRHDDHKWELGEAAFRSWLAEWLPSDRYTVHHAGVGDAVNGVHTTQGVIVRRGGESQ